MVGYYLTASQQATFIGPVIGHGPVQCAYVIESQYVARCPIMAVAVFSLDLVGEQVFKYFRAFMRAHSIDLYRVARITV